MKDDINKINFSLHCNSCLLEIVFFSFPIIFLSLLIYVLFEYSFDFNNNDILIVDSINSNCNGFIVKKCSINYNLFKYDIDELTSEFRMEYEKNEYDISIDDYVENKLEFYKHYNSYVENDYSIKTIGIFKNNVPQNVYYSKYNHSITTNKHSIRIDDIIFLHIFLLFCIDYFLLRLVITNIQLILLYKYLKNNGTYYKNVKITEFKKCYYEVNDSRVYKVFVDFTLPDGHNVLLKGKIYSNNVENCEVLIDENNPKKYIIEEHFSI